VGKPGREKKAVAYAKLLNSASSLQDKVRKAKGAGPVFFGPAPQNPMRSND